jgi:hypothetical protein
MLQLLETSLEVKVEMLDFAMARNDKRDIPLTWHLSKSEINTITSALDSGQNVQHIEKLRTLLSR